MKTVLHAYHFDVSKPEEKTAWEALKTKLAAWPHRMKAHGSGPRYYDTGRQLDGQTIDLETAHLFNNQWNSAPIEGFSAQGYRLFDWAQDSLWRNGIENKITKQGYYLEQTDEMREVRRNTAVCGYCGKQEPAAKGYVFCPHCIDSEYLKEDDLHVTRMRPVDNDKWTKQLEPLTEAEKAHLLPLYRQAQLHGTTERGKARIAKAKADIETEYTKAVANATEKRDAARWIIAKAPGLLANWLFYTHTGKHSFGWRKPLSAGEVSGLLDVISEFPFVYEIKTEDGRTLENYAE